MARKNVKGVNEGLRDGRFIFCTHIQFNSAAFNFSETNIKFSTEIV